MVKRKWERGSRSLQPLQAFTQPLAFQFIKTAKVVEDKHPLIQDLHFELNPFHSSTWSKKISINMVIGPFKINFENYPFLSLSHFLIHQLISNQDNIQNLSPLYKDSLGHENGIADDFTQSP